MFVGTSDTTVISSIKVKVRRLSITFASVGQRDGSFSANLRGNTAENRQKYFCLFNLVFSFAPSLSLFIYHFSLPYPPLSLV